MCYIFSSADAKNRIREFTVISIPNPSNMANHGSELVVYIQKQLGVTFDKPLLIHEAFMAAGAVNRDGNKDLALIGDSALQLFLQTQGRARNASRGMQVILLE